MNINGRTNDESIGLSSGNAGSWGTADPAWFSKSSTRPVLCRLLRLMAVFLATFASGPIAARADDPAPNPQVIAKYFKLSSPVNATVTSTMRNVVIALKDEARKVGKRGMLIIEVPQGQSEFHLVFGLADFLTSADAADVTTVAWVPRTLTGHNAIIPLACNEIVMPSDVALGDIGEGEEVSLERRVVIRLLADRLRNPKVNAGLIEGMMSPQTELRQLTLELPSGAIERMVVTPTGAEAVIKEGLTVKESRIIKDRGTVGLFRGDEARQGDYLVKGTAESTAELLKMYDLPPNFMETPLESEPVWNARLIEVSGGIDTVRTSFLKRQLERAVESGANLIIFQLETSGGHIDEARQLATVISDLSHRGVKTVCWVPRNAIGPAALVALACDEIYLTDKGRIGAVSQLGPMEGQVEEREFYEQSMRWLAEQKSRPVAILMAMAVHDTKVFQVTNRKTGETSYRMASEVRPDDPEWIMGPMLAESGAGLLLLSARRAAELGVAQPPVADLEAVKLAISLGADTPLRLVKRSWVDDLVFTLNRRSVTALLFFVTFICLYMEAQSNTGVLGIVAIICFALYFWSRFLGGTAGGLEVLLFMLGLGAIAMEIFVMPGFGIFGVSGGLLVIVSMVMASQTFGSIEYGRDFEQVVGTLKVMAAAFTMVIGMAVLIHRYLPRVPFMSSMILIPPGDDGRLNDEAPRLKTEVFPVSELVGERGTTATVLRPAGKAILQGRPVDVVSDGPFIEPDTMVEVIRVSGNNVVVRQV